MIGLLLSICLGASAQSIAGRVLDAGSGAGLAAVRVDLLSWAAGERHTITDGSGSFRFDGVEPGEYRIRYQASGYQPVEEKSLIRLAAGSDMQLEARLVAWATVRGRVVDPAGRPMPRARLELRSFGLTASGRVYFRTSWGAGGGSLLADAPTPMVFQSQADARGEFTMQLFPGAYTLTALAAPDAPPPAPLTDGGKQVWRRTHPFRLAVASQSELSGVELRMEAAPAFTLRGQVLLPDRAPASQATVALEDGLAARKTESRADGTFELPAVPRGRWCLSAEWQKARALECIDVGSQDVRGLRFDLSNPLPLAIGVRTLEEGGTVPPALGAVLLSMAASPERPLAAHPIVLASDAEGRFSSFDAYPGSYRFARAVGPPPPPLYLAGVLAGEQDLLRVDGAITPGMPLTLLYSNRSGVVAGKVEHCASGTVILIPADPALRGRGWSRSGACDSSGEYEIAGVPPGDYLALALAGTSPVPAFDESLLQRGVAVEVRPGARKTLPLSVTVAPVY